MSKVQVLRAFVSQRLIAAVDEIFGLFEKTIAEYEEELSQSKEENERQRRLLDAVLKPEVRLQRAEVQQLPESDDEVAPVQQEWSPSLDQEDHQDPESPHIKEEEEEEEPWNHQNGEQPQEPEEASIAPSLQHAPAPFIPVLVKSEDEEEPQSSQFHPSAAEENTDAELLSSQHAETMADTYEREGPEAGGGLESDGASLRRARDEQWFGCSECSKRFRKQAHLVEHFRIHTGEKPFICSICGMRFSLKGNMMTHMKVHTGEKRFICSVCGKRFARKGHLVTHMTIHTGEKPFGCSVCGKRFGQNSTMKKHMAVHTGVKPFSCNVCDKRFTWHYQFKKHACVRRRLETLENFGKIAGDMHQV